MISTTLYVYDADVVVIASYQMRKRAGRTRVHSEYKVYATIPTEAINIVGRPRRASIYGITYTLSHCTRTAYTIYMNIVYDIYSHLGKKHKRSKQKKKKKGNTTPRGGRCLFYKRCIQSATVSILRFSVYWTLRARTTHIAGCRHGYKHKHLYTLCRRRRVPRIPCLCIIPCHPETPDQSTGAAYYSGSSSKLLLYVGISVCILCSSFYTKRFIFLYL